MNCQNKLSNVLSICLFRDINWISSTFFFWRLFTRTLTTKYQYTFTFHNLERTAFFILSEVVVFYVKKMEKENEGKEIN